MSLWESAEYCRDSWYKYQEAKETITPIEQSISPKSDGVAATETEEERCRKNGMKYRQRSYPATRSEFSTLAGGSTGKNPEISSPGSFWDIHPSVFS